jgi:hypothetical protein
VGNPALKLLLVRETGTANASVAPSGLQAAPTTASESDTTNLLRVGGVLSAGVAGRNGM